MIDIQCVTAPGSEAWSVLRLCVNGILKAAAPFHDIYGELLDQTLWQWCDEGFFLFQHDNGLTHADIFEMIWMSESESIPPAKYLNILQFYSEGGCIHQEINEHVGVISSCPYIFMKTAFTNFGFNFMAAQSRGEARAWLSHRWCWQEERELRAESVLFNIYRGNIVWSQVLSHTESSFV